MKSSRVYVPRLVRLNTLSGTGDVILTAGQVATALGVTGSNNVSFKLRGMKVWNTTSAANNSNYLSVRLSSSATLLTTQLVTGEDWGNVSNLAGVRFSVPDQLAKSLEGVSATSSTPLATLSGFTGGTGNSQTFCVDVSVWVVGEDV